MNNIEELTFRYLSSYFNQDLNESLEHISEEDLKSALIDLNILAVALNQYVTEQLQIPTNPFSDEIGLSTKPSIYRQVPRNRPKEYTRFDPSDSKYDFSDPNFGSSTDRAINQFGKPEVSGHEIKTLGNKVLDYFKRAQDHRIRQQSQVQKQLSDIREPRAEFEKDLNIFWKPDPNARLRTPYELTHATPEQRAASKRQTELEARHDELNRKDIKTLIGFDIMNPEDDEKYADEYLRTLSDRTRRRDFASGKGMDPYPKNYESQGRPMDPSDPNSLRQSDIELDSPAAVKSDKYYGLTKDQVKAIRDRELLDRQITRTLVNAEMATEKQKSDKLAAEIKAGRGTAAGERRINDLLSKPANSARAEAARQQALASRESVRQSDRESGNVTAISDPDRFEFYSSKSRDVTPTGKVGGGDAAFSLEDRLGYHVGRARQERDATSKRMLDMQMMREFGTTDPAKMRYEQYGGFAGGVGDGGGSSYGQVSARNGWDRFDLNKRIKDARRSQNQQEAIPWNQDLMDRIVARTNTPEAIADRERQTQQFDAASRARDEYASSERGQAEIDRRVSAENASRQQRGLPPLNAAAENRLRRSVIADGGRRDQRAAERDARMGLPPVGTPQPQTTEQPQTTPSSEEPYQSEEDYMRSVFPYQSEEDYMKSVFPSRTVDSNSVPGSENAPPGARTTFTGPGGAGFSTLPSPTPIISTRGIINNLSGRTSVASALNSKGFRPANPTLNRLRPGGMIA